MSSKFNKIIKYVILAFIIFFIGKIVFSEINDTRPFKFERYKTSGQLEEAAGLRFTKGRCIDNVVNDLEKSKAHCYKQKSFERSTDYEIIVSCIYNTSLFSLHPFERYRIGIFGNKKHELVKLEALRNSGLMLYIP